MKKLLLTGLAFSAAIVAGQANAATPIPLLPVSVGTPRFLIGALPLLLLHRHLS